jgi:uncharacterized protein (DUF58 family)
MLCTRRFLALLGATAFLAVLGVFVEEALWVLAAADAALVAGWVTDWVLARRIRASLHLERLPVISLSAGAPQALGLAVENGGRLAARLALREVFPATVEVRRPVLEFSVPGRSRSVVKRVVRPRRRGRLRLDGVHARAEGPLGLARTQWRAALPLEVPVMPNLAAITELERVFTFGAQQAHTVRRSDFTAEGFEFESLRDYVEGDDSRHIDWKSTAKRHKVTTRHYEIERSQRVMLALDCGRLMGSEVGGARRLDLAVNAAVLLAYVAGLKDDHVGLIAFAHDVMRFLPPKKGRGHFRELVKAVADLEPLPFESDYALAFAHLRSRVRRRSLIVVMTDLVDPEASGHVIESLAGLRRRHLPLCVSIRDAALEGAATAVPETAEGVHTGVVAREMLRDVERAMAELRARGCLARRAPAGELSAAVVQTYLQVKQRNLL